MQISILVMSGIRGLVDQRLLDDGAEPEFVSLHTTRVRVLRSSDHYFGNNLPRSIP